MHVSCIEPQEEGFSRIMSSLNKYFGGSKEIFVDRLHSLHGQRTCILYLLSAVTVCPAMQDTTGAILFLEFGVILFVWIVCLLWFFLGVKVIEVTEELI